MMKNILWDFDGVILDSMEIRDKGFIEVFQNFNSQHVSDLLKYHRQNGGLSRYVKIRYFFEKILGQAISETEVKHYATNFSEIMRKQLVDPGNLIMDSVKFIQENYKELNFHIVSGSDQKELRFLCSNLHLSPFFKSIHGSPTPKISLVQHILLEYKYNTNETCLIGDSINDYEAAVHNDVKFFGYNNLSLANKGKYIKDFSSCDYFHNEDFI